MLLHCSLFTHHSFVLVVMLPCSVRVETECVFSLQIIQPASL